MNKRDVIVIGGGLSGLTAALAAAKRGLTVTLLAKGAGTLAFGGGVIDVLGYLDKKLVNNPSTALASLPTEHPYQIIGPTAAAAALDFFGQVCADADYSLDGSFAANLLVPTAAGTLKPSCLIPKTMNAVDMPAAKEITVVGFAGLKDFYPQLVINGLQQLSGYANKQYHTVEIQPRLPGGRDISALDIARWLDSQEGQQDFLCQLKACTTAGSYLLLPPVLGTEPSYAIWRKVEQELSSRVVELAAPPPAITGSRLRTLLMRALKQHGIQIIEQAHVRRTDCQGQRCIAVVTQHLDRERRYEADSFIVATGGFLGGGLTATPNGLSEPIWGLPVTLGPAGQQHRTSLFDKHPMFSAGIAVSERLQPCNAAGQVLFTNVHIAGNLLAGYDYCQEKSGNGVAVVSAYQAAQVLAGRESA